MNEPVANKTVNSWRGLALFTLDIWLGAAAITAVSYLLFRWSGNFFAINSFWGDEPSQLGQFINVVKTAASITLIISLISFGGGTEISRLTPSYFAAYTVHHNNTNLPGDAKKGQIRLFSGLLGGSILALLFAFLFLPWLSALNIISGDMALTIKPIRLFGPERILITAENPITSTPENNLFELDMEKDQEYLVFVESVAQRPGIYFLSFRKFEHEQRKLSILGHGTIQSDGISWQLVSNPENARVKFDVDYTGTEPGEYRVYVQIVRRNGASINTSPTESGKQVQAVLFEGNAGDAYILTAFTNDYEWVTITLSGIDGQQLLTTSGSPIEMALFLPSETQQYEVVVRDDHNRPLDFFVLRIDQYQK